MIIDRNGVKCDYYDNVTNEDYSDITNSGASYILCKVGLQAQDDIEWLTQNGFFIADTRVECHIRLSSIKEIKRKRFETSTCCIDEIDLSIVQKMFHDSFLTDRRFHLRHEYDQSLANQIIDAYIQQALAENMSVIKCTYKGQIIGLALLERVEDAYYVFLAAVLEKYQGSGAAIELYSTAAEYALSQKAKTLYGRVSVSNTSVMNLYGELGAKFYKPQYLYIKERN